MSNRLLDAIARDPDNASFPFQCPRTKLDMVVKLPERKQCKAARRYAATEFGPERSALMYSNPQDLEEYFNHVRGWLLAHCVFVKDSYEPIGLDAVDALDEATLKVYDGFLSDLEARFDPSVKTMTDEDIEALREEIKKKEPATRDYLRRLGVDTLVNLVLTIGGPQEPSETAMS